MEKAEQFKAGLRTAFTPRQDQTQQVVDTFAQHPSAPGPIEHLVQKLPNLYKWIDSHQQSGLFQAVIPFP